MSRYLKYTIIQDDTLQSIAQATSGDISIWQDIATFNNLRYPYIVDTPKEKLADPGHLVTWGDVIVLPIELDVNDIDAYKINRQDQEEIEKIALGSDLSFKTVGLGSWDDIFQLQANNHGDLAIVSGLDNLKQAIVNRLLTAKGSLEGHPNFGSEIEENLGLKTNNQLEIVNNDISRAILSDGRIEGCVCNNATISGETYDSDWTVTIEGIDTQFSWVISRDSTGNFTLV